MNARRFIKAALPPFVANAVRRLVYPRNADAIRFTGDYRSWEEAEKAAGNYATPEILNRTRTALLKVKNGDAAFERDSLVFDTVEYSFPLLAGLLRVAAANEGKLSVLDFGGSLGSTYFQCRNFLAGLKELRWSVVEQPAHVACGQGEFANEELRFYETIDDCLLGERPNILLLSSVLQYLPKPYEFLDAAVLREFEHILVDRTAFALDGRDRLTVQHVPAWIYNASYPAWFLSEARFRVCFDRQQYRLVYEFSGADVLQPEGGRAYFKGFQFERKTAMKRQ